MAPGSLQGEARLPLAPFNRELMVLEARCDRLLFFVRALALF